MELSLRPQDITCVKLGPILLYGLDLRTLCTESTGLIAYRQIWN